MKQQIVNQQKAIGKLKIGEDMRRKQENVRKTHNERAEEEDMMKKMKEQEVIAMERLELELINKLNNTVALQKQAYEELDKALKEPSAMMAPYLKNGGIPPASGYKTEEIAQQQQ